MKKIAVLILAVLMLFCIASSSLAEASIYWDYLIGETEISVTNNVFNLSSDEFNVVGGKYHFGNRWSVSGEYVQGRMFAPIGYYYYGIVEDKFRAYSIKVGYTVFDNKELRLDLSAGNWPYLLLRKVWFF